MNNISRLVAEIKDDVNNDDSMILDVFNRCLNGLFKVIIWTGIPFIIYLLFQFSQLY